MTARGSGRLRRRVETLRLRQARSQGRRIGCISPGGRCRDDPLARTLEVRQLDPGGRHVTLLSAADGSHAAPGCDGLTLDRDALWTEMDRRPDETEE